MKQMTLADEVLYASLKSQLRTLMDRERYCMMCKGVTDNVVWTRLITTQDISSIDAQIKELEEKYR